jgi:hypothetical protein
MIIRIGRLTSTIYSSILADGVTDSRKTIDNQYRYTIDDQTNVPRLLEREAVVKLATRSIEGVKELQSTMDAFLETQRTRGSKYRRE